MKIARNVAASHRAKLLALAQRRGDDFQFLLGRWAIERFLYRLSRSSHKNDFVLKGAMLFLAWGGEVYRPTRDLDLLGFGSAELNDVTGRVREICSAPADDGIVFDLTGIRAERIREDAAYEGVRVRVPASLDGARVTMQIDIGFGDKVDPAPTELPFPVLLPLDVPVVRAYPLEALIAEKFQAMVVLGIANSRMKDFFDIWTFASTHRFEISRFGNAIRSTFQQRRTPLPEVPPLALTDEFLPDRAKRTQWNAFCRRLGLRDAPSFDVTGRLLVRLLMPAVEQARSRKPELMTWEPPGPWRKAEEATA
jgi:hypothetical protein